MLPCLLPYLLLLQRWLLLLLLHLPAAALPAAAAGALLTCSTLPCLVLLQCLLLRCCAAALLPSYQAAAQLKPMSQLESLKLALDVPSCPTGLLLLHSSAAALPCACCSR
jgi:hypothetical protein